MGWPRVLCCGSERKAMFWIYVYVVGWDAWDVSGGSRSPKGPLAFCYLVRSKRHGVLEKRVWKIRGYIAEVHYDFDNPVAELL